MTTQIKVMLIGIATISIVIIAICLGIYTKKVDLVKDDTIDTLKYRETDICVAMDKEDIFCINGYLYKKRSKTKDIWGNEVNPFIPMEGVCSCKTNPLETELVEQNEILKKELNLCRTELISVIEVTERELDRLQNKIAEMELTSLYNNKDGIIQMPPKEGDTALNPLEIEPEITEPVTVNESVKTESKDDVIKEVPVNVTTKPVEAPKPEVKEEKKEEVKKDVKKEQPKKDVKSTKSKDTKSKDNKKTKEDKKKSKDTKAKDTKPKTTSKTKDCKTTCVDKKEVK